MLWTNAFAARVSQNVSTITAKIMVLLYEYHHKYFCCTIKLSVPKLMKKVSKINLNVLSRHNKNVCASLNILHLSLNSSKFRIKLLVWYLQSYIFCHNFAHCSLPVHQWFQNFSSNHPVGLSRCSTLKILWDLFFMFVSLTSFLYLRTVSSDNSWSLSLSIVLTASVSYLVWS